MRVGKYMSPSDLQRVQNVYHQLTDDLKRAEDRIAFLQDEEECARITLQGAKTQTSRLIVERKCNSIEITEEEEHANEIVTNHQEQLNWVKIQLAVAEEERERLGEERQYIEDQIKDRTRRA
jgi:hypothetical protein